jgi:hypothetical protein
MDSSADKEYSVNMVQGEARTIGRSDGNATCARASFVCRRSDENEWGVLTYGTSPSKSSIVDGLEKA